MIRNTLLITTFLIISISLPAQVERDMPDNDESIEIKLNQNVLYGKLLDKNTGKVLEAASVQLFLTRNDLPDSLIRGMLSLHNGDFRLSNLTPGSQFRLILSAIGYRKGCRTIKFGSVKRSAINIDLGNILMESEVQLLSGVTIVTSKPALQLGVDRKIFNVDKNLTTVGAYGC